MTNWTVTTSNLAGGQESILWYQMGFMAFKYRITRTGRLMHEYTLHTN